MIKADQIWIHRKTSVEYQVVDTCIIKNSTQDIDKIGVVYNPLNSNDLYVRDRKEFKK